MLEERRLSSPIGSSRGKPEAFEFNSEIPREFLECHIRQFVDNVEEMFLAQTDHLVSPWK